MAHAKLANVLLAHLDLLPTAAAVHEEPWFEGPVATTGARFWSTDPHIVEFETAHVGMCTYVILLLICSRMCDPRMCVHVPFLESWSIVYTRSHQPSTSLTGHGCRLAEQGRRLSGCR